jgi:hypothetical protein
MSMRSLPSWPKYERNRRHNQRSPLPATELQLRWWPSLVLMVGGVEEAEFCVTDFGRFDGVPGLG